MISTMRFAFWGAAAIQLLAAFAATSGWIPWSMYGWIAVVFTPVFATWMTMKLAAELFIDFEITSYVIHNYGHTISAAVFSFAEQEVTAWPDYKVRLLFAVLTLSMVVLVFSAIKIAEIGIVHAVRASVTTANCILPTDKLGTQVAAPKTRGRKRRSEVERLAL